MKQTSRPASSWLLTTVQITLAVVLIVATFVALQDSEKTSTATAQHRFERSATTGDFQGSSIAQALYETDGSSNYAIARCKFDDDANAWSAPSTGHTPAGATQEVLKWGSNVDDSGLGVTAPLSIQPTQPVIRTAQLPEEFTSQDEIGGWGSLTTEEVKMIERQRNQDVGLDAIEELENDFPADDFDSSEWVDPIGDDSVPSDRIEPVVEDDVVEDDGAGQDAEDPGTVDPGAIESGAIESGTIESGDLEESEPEFEETPHQELFETANTDGPSSESILEMSIPESEEPEDFGDGVIPLIDLPKDEPELTELEKERNELKMEPLPKFEKKSKDIFGEFDDPVVAIKALPDLKGKKSKKPLKPLKRSNIDPTWWAAQIHQPQLPGRQSLETTLDEVIFMALRAAPQVQIFNTQPQIQRATLNEAAAEFDWSTFVNSTWNDINEPIGSSLTAGGTVTEFVQREWVFESGLRKRLRSGGDLSIAQNFGTLDSNSTFLIPDNQGNSELVLDYRQPLLQGAGPSFNTSQIALANLDLESISSESLAELQGYLVQVVSAYWDIYLQRAMLVQNRQSVKLAEELFRQLKSRKGIDVLNDQLLRAEAAVATRKSSMIRSEYDLINAQDTLINLVLGAKSETVDRIELLPEPMMLPLGLHVESEALVQAAIRNRPEVRSAIAQIRSSAIRKQVAANQLLPRLDAVLSSYLSGLRGDRDIGGSFTDQFTTGEPSYTVGIEFEVPIGNRAAKSRLQRSQLEAQILHRAFERQVGDVVLEARIAGREIERLNRENETNFKGLQKAAMELDQIQQRQKLRLDQGKSGSLYIEDLLASQARLTAAEARLALSQTNQAIALIDVKRATGELLRSGGQLHQPVPYQAVPFEEVLIQPAQLGPQPGTQPVNNFVDPFSGASPVSIQGNGQPLGQSVRQPLAQPGAPTQAQLLTQAQAQPLTPTQAQSSMPTQAQPLVQGPEPTNAKSVLSQESAQVNQGSFSHFSQHSQQPVSAQARWEDSRPRYDAHQLR